MSLTTPATALLGMRHPIVLAPMDAVAGGRLAAAVSGAGGLGLIGGGYGDEAWLRKQFRLAAGSRVGCGFITWSLERQPRLLDVALEDESVAVMLSFGDPAPFAEKIRASGAVLMCQIQTRQQAERALEVGVDVLVAQGSEAGGHGYGTRTTMTLVPEIADLLSDTGSQVVLLAAGGIADGRGLAAALALGAAGAMVGTRFYAAHEALSTAEARQQVVAATGEDTCRTTVYDIVRELPWPTGHTMGVLDNEFTSRWHGAEAELRDRLEAVRAQYRRAVRDREYAIANVTAGQASGLVKAVHPAAEIVTSMATQAAALLTAASWAASA